MTFYGPHHSGDAPGSLEEKLIGRRQPGCLVATGRVAMSSSVIAAVLLSGDFSLRKLSTSWATRTRIRGFFVTFERADRPTSLDITEVCKAVNCAQCVFALLRHPHNRSGTERSRAESKSLRRIQGIK